VAEQYGLVLYLAFGVQVPNSCVRGGGGGYELGVLLEASPLSKSALAY
jgi:hypothetical protein